MSSVLSVKCTVDLQLSFFPTSLILLSISPLLSSQVQTMTEGRHVLLFPFIAQGHMIPFIALARLLEQKTSFTITIITTTGNVKTLQSAIPQNSAIRIASLPLNSSDHGLPPNAENTDSLPHHLIIRLFQASKNLKPSFELLISTMIREDDGKLPLCIISDFFYGWTVEIANRLGIFHSVFFSTGAYGGAVFVSLWLNLPHASTDSDEFSLPDFPESGPLHRSQLSYFLKEANGSDPWSQSLRQEISSSLKTDGLLINTVEELEQTGLRYFRRKTNRPIWTIGPLKSEGRRGKVFGVSTDTCISWLDLHRPSSVLFVSFGSQNTISPAQMMELAKGLEDSCKAFIWVVRPPLGFDINGEFRPEWLPEQFEDRIREKKQGILVRKWAPQLEILSHKSTGAFLSHCGWNSVLESLSRGVPIIGWPIAADQYYNSKMLEENGVCVEIARGISSKVDNGSVRMVIEKVMGETEKGEEMRRKALEIKITMETAFKGSSLKAVQEFIDTIILAQ